MRVVIKPLNEIEKAYWQKYLLTLAPDQRPANPYVEACYAGTQEITDDLLSLYLIGKKIAGSSLVEGLNSDGIPIPKPGNFWILLNSKNEPGCLLRTEKVVFNKFKDVPEEIAKAEGEGDLSLAYWRKVHDSFYRPYLEKWGIKDIQEATVVTEYFRLLFT